MSAPARTCLIVDDSRVIRRVAREMMQELKFEVREAENGQDGLDKCREAMPDAVLLDWNMPVMDGLTFLKGLRQEPGGDGPRVLFCTTENDFAHISAAIAAGANEYVMKPFDRDILETKLQQAGLL